MKSFFVLKSRLRQFLAVRWRRFIINLRFGCFPHCINIETSTFCNRSCYYCANSVLPFKKQLYMSEEIFNKVVFYLKEMKWSGSICFNFISEPLLDKNLESKIFILRHALPKARIFLYSNGDRLTKERMISLIEAGIDEVQITEHPPYSKEWEDKILEIKSQFPKYIDFRGKVENEPWMMTWAGTVMPKNAKRIGRCIQGYDSLMILYNGDVNLCCCEPRRKYIQGNVLQNSLLDIWRYSKVLDIRENARMGKPINPECKACIEGRLINEGSYSGSNV